VFLRGINVGGRGKLVMAELREICESRGCSKVATYIQSGNLVLESELTARQLVDALGQAIADAAAITPAVMVRTPADIKRVLADNPYPDADDRHLHVGFLSAKPARQAVADLADVDCAPEQFTVIGTEVYLYYVDGMGKSRKLVKVPFERRLGVAMTARNLRTVRKLAEMAGA
jgi:uncharacterized protein (DUF1697 family)